LTEEFSGILENFLGVKKTPISFVEEWDKNPPAEAHGMPLLKSTEKARVHAPPPSDCRPTTN
jgi:hypothetical protein